MATTSETAGPTAGRPRARTVVIQGGTDGIGRALAQTYLERGDAVVVLGRSPERGEAFLAAAHGLGAADRAYFLPADLSVIAENRRVIRRVGELVPAVDRLILCARHTRSRRRETADGLEETFALFYLSRFLLSHGLVERLAKSVDPVVLNIAGPGGSRPVPWDDLQFRRDYHGVAALGRNGRLNDLLAVAFAERYEASGIRYLLFHPGVVATGFSGSYDAAGAAEIETLKATGKSVAQSVGQILPCLDDPPREPVSAFVEGRWIEVGTPLFDPADARRLHDLTTRLLSGR